MRVCFQTLRVVYNLMRVSFSARVRVLANNNIIEGAFYNLTRVSFLPVRVIDYC